MDNKYDSTNSGSAMGEYVNKIYLNKDFVIFKKYDGYYSFYKFGIDANDLKISVNSDDLEKVKKRIDSCMSELIEILNKEIWSRAEKQREEEKNKKIEEDRKKKIGFNFFDLVNRDGV